MAQTIRSAKQKLANGTYSNPIPFGADGVNISLKNGYDLESTLGEVDIVNKGAIQTQLNQCVKDIIDRLTKTEAASFIKGIDFNENTFTFTKYDDSTQTVELSTIGEYTGKENEQINTKIVNNIVEAILKTASIDETYLTTELQTRLTNMEDKYTKAEVDALMENRSEFVEVEAW